MRGSAWHRPSAASSIGRASSPTSSMSGHAPYSHHSGRKRKQTTRTELARLRACASPDLNYEAASYLPAAAFCAAQRFLTASAMRFRPSGERCLFFFLFAGFALTWATAAAFLDAAATFLGLPAFFFAAGAARPLRS